jgi:glycerophosphoryl diester phosphodiesterase
MFEQFNAIRREKGTLVFAHRGASGYAPMNTLPAFTLAADQGADGAELDVWLSKDGVPVVIHDMDVDATTDGHGRVADFTLAELRVLDSGRWKGEEFANTKIPTLGEVFESVGSRLLINVEIKSEEGMIEGVERVVADTIADHRMIDRVIVSSFDPRVLVRFRELMPQVAIGFLEYPGTPPEAYDLAATLKCEAQHPHYSQVDAAFVARARERAAWVNTWTINEVAEAKRLQSLDVDVIMTDFPDTMLNAIRA